MGRRALVIALASFLVIAVGAVIVWAIIAVGSNPSAAPDPTVGPTAGPTVSPTATPTPTPSATPTAEPTDPPDVPPASVTALAATPKPHAVQLEWTNPSEEDLHQVLVVRVAGATPPAGVDDGTVVGTLPPTQNLFVDTSAGLKPGTKVSYSVFARDAAGAESPAAGVTVTLPIAITVTPVDVAGSVTQQSADATLTDAGSLAFTAFDPAEKHTAAVKPPSGASGAVTTKLTEPKGAAPGAVVWTYTVPNAALRSLAEGAKRDEVFSIVLAGPRDSVATAVTITLLGINDPPTASGIPGETAIVGDAFAFPIPTGVFADPDATDQLVLTADSLPGWLAFDGAAFTGTPSAGDVGTITVPVTATDLHGLTVSADAVIDVITPLPAPNQPPVPAVDDVLFDLSVDPLQASAGLLGNDTDPDGGPNPLSAIPASGVWTVNGETAGSYSIDAAGTLLLDSGVVADGPLQQLGPGEQATATIPYSVTDGADTVASEVHVTVSGAAPADDKYFVTKVFVLEPATPGRALHGIG
jgi:VCBS repeat-containing protein